MKMIRILLIIAFTLGVLSITPKPVSAGAFTYFSSINVQNLVNETASITLFFYKKDGTQATAPVTDSVGPLGSKVYFPLPVGSGFDGSVVISSTKPIASISNIHGDNFDANAAYVGSNSGNSSVKLPLLMKNNSGYSSWFNVQNVGSQETTVTVNYDDGTSNNALVKPGASHTFDQLFETHTSAVLSADVSSSSPVENLAATVVIENNQQMLAYSGFTTSGAKLPVMPLINSNNSGIVTGIDILNTGGSSTSVTISYTPSLAGTACTETQTIPAGERKTFALLVFAGVPGITTDCTAGSTFIGSARVTTNSNDQNLVANINQFTSIYGEAYTSFDPGAATAKVVLPLIMDRNSGYWTSINLYNVGTSTTVNCTFTGSTYTWSPSLNQYEGASDLQYGKIAPGYVGVATCTATGGGKIVAIVNELGPSPILDQLLVYEGINVTP